MDKADKSILLKRGGKEFKIELKECSSLFSKAKGLMFLRREKAKALLFNFKGNTMASIHSFFVFFPFIAIWLDEAGSIVEQRVIQPFSPYIRPERQFNRLLEIPLNNNYKEVFDFIVGDRKL